MASSDVPRLIGLLRIEGSFHAFRVLRIVTAASIGCATLHLPTSNYECEHCLRHDTELIKTRIRIATLLQSTNALKLPGCPVCFDPRTTIPTLVRWMTSLHTRLLLAAIHGCSLRHTSHRNNFALPLWSVENGIRSLPRNCGSLPPRISDRRMIWFSV